MDRGSRRFVRGKGILPINGYSLLIALPSKKMSF